MTSVKCCLVGKLIRDSRPRVFTGSWSHWHSMPSMSQNSRFPRGKQLFNLNHIIYTNGLSKVSHSYSYGNGGNPSEIYVTRCQPRGTLQAGSSAKESSLRPALLTLFCTPGNKDSSWEGWLKTSFQSRSRMKSVHTGGNDGISPEPKLGEKCI